VGHFFETQCLVLSSVVAFSFQYSVSSVVNKHAVLRCHSSAVSVPDMKSIKFLGSGCKNQGRSGFGNDNSFRPRRWTASNADMPTIPLFAELFPISAIPSGICKICEIPLFHSSHFSHKNLVFSYINLLKKSYHQRPSVKLKLHHNKNRLGLRPRPQLGSLQCSPTSPSWISIYRPFGPLLSAIRASVVSDSSFWFSNVGMSANGKHCFVCAVVLFGEEKVVAMY